MTQVNATGLAFSWIQREKPVRCSVESGSELPAMNPATQAKACNASTSEFRNRISSTFDRPRWIGDTRGRDRGSGQAAPRRRSGRTTASSAMATEAPPPIQPRSTGHGWPFHRARAPRVWRKPRTSA